MKAVSHTKLSRQYRKVLGEAVKNNAERLHTHTGHQNPRLHTGPRGRSIPHVYSADLQNLTHNLKNKTKSTDEMHS